MEKLLGQPCPFQRSLVPDASHLKSAREPGSPDSQTTPNMLGRGQLASVWGGQVCRELHRVPRPKFWSLAGPDLEGLPVSLHLHFQEVPGKGSW